jgi:hypothetical protein
MGLLSLLVGALLAVLRRLLLEVLDASGLPGSLVVAGLVGVAFAALMLLAGYGLRIREISEFWRKALRAIRFGRNES